MGFVYYFSHSKVKVSDSINFYNQAPNSHAAMFDKLFLEERGNGLRSKTHEPVLFERSEFTGECAELPTESRKLCTAARRCRGLGVKPRVCLFFAGVSFLRQKRNAETRVVYIT